MIVFINNEEKVFDNNSNLRIIVEASVFDIKGLAVAVNNAVIPKTEWEDKIIQENDKILLIRATQGG